MLSGAYKRYVLTAMTTVYMLNLVDRGLMVLLLQPMKEDLQLTDTQMGFVTGIAFALFYATLGVPLARWADRGNRVTITSLAIGLWGVTVMGCLFVTNYVQLIVARVAAAIGESGCKPPTYSLVGDYYPEPAARTRAMAIYFLGSPLAQVLSYMVGGWLNRLYGWRMTFFLMGILGLIVAVIVKLTIVEPRSPAGKKIDVVPQPSMQEVMASLLHQRSLRHLTIALILLYTMTMGMAPWYAAFMIRSHGMETSELGVWFGLIFSLGGIVGILVGGYVASSWIHNDERHQMRLSAVTVALLLPCFIAFLLLPQRHHALIALSVLTTVGGVFVGPTYALMQRLVPDEMRATMMSVVMLLTNLIGMGLGPLIVGVVSDSLLPTFGGDSLRYAMLTLSFVALWSGCHFWMVSTTVMEDLSDVAKRLHRDPSPSGHHMDVAEPVPSKLT